MTAKLVPDGIVAGSVRPAILNSELVNWSEEIVTAPSEAVKVTGRLAVFPTVTLPKLSDIGDIVSTGAPVPATGIESTESIALLFRISAPVT